MKGKRALLLTALAAALVAGGLGARVLLRERVVVTRPAAVSRRPNIHPDYADVTIPPNIAPLNFCVDEPGMRHVVRVRSTRGQPIEVASDDGRAVIPPGPWRALLRENAGEDLYFDVYAQAADGSWTQFAPVRNVIAREDVDPYVEYRVINVLYNFYAKMKMFEYNLETADESLILDDRSFGDGCMNCHTLLNNSTDRMVIQIRSAHIDYGSGMLVIDNGVVTKVDARTQANPRLAAFASWHPSGRALVFSTNKVRQFFHAARDEVREGIDLVSDLAVYIPATQTVLSPPSLSRPDVQETWPAWAPDGKYLYYCVGPVLWPAEVGVPPPRFREMRYDLMRISYDVDTGSWGEPEVVLSAEKAGMSITLPRVSPDGRFLMFCMSRYSGFAALQPDADLYMMDLESGDYWKLDCSSDEADSWHSWSSNGRWIVFSSKRVDKIFMKAYIAYVDGNGRTRKPFVMPQRDPSFYDSFIRVYHVPEFAKNPIRVRGEALAEVIRSAPWVKVDVHVTGASPRASSQRESPPASAPPEAEPRAPEPR
jgi:hypothetical protein